MTNAASLEQPTGRPDVIDRGWLPRLPALVGLVKAWLDRSPVRCGSGNFRVAVLNVWLRLYEMFTHKSGDVMVWLRYDIWQFNSHCIARANTGAAILARCCWEQEKERQPRAKLTRDMLTCTEEQAMINRRSRPRQRANTANIHHKMTLFNLESRETEISRCIDIEILSGFEDSHA